MSTKPEDKLVLACGEAMNNIVNVGVFARTTRLALGLSLRNAAKEMGIATSHLVRIEKGVIFPSLNIIKRIYNWSLAKYDERTEKEKQKYKRKADVPNPGSDEAGELGCTCPVLDNSHGKGYYGTPGIFAYNLDCPVHKKETNNV